LEKCKRAYDLLANGDIAEHMEGLLLLDEARTLDAETVMRYEHEIDQYKMLTINATKPTTGIYLTDDQDNLVQQETGFMQTSVAPGTYFVRFGRKSEPRRIDLTSDMSVDQ
jgi:hypothetical protein